MTLIVIQGHRTMKNLKWWLMLLFLLDFRKAVAILSTFSLPPTQYALTCGNLAFNCFQLLYLHMDRAAQERHTRCLETD